MSIGQNITTQLDAKEIESQIWTLMESVVDPEVPVLSVLDLGIIRKIDVAKSEKDEWQVEVFITPTYSGCPAMDVISINIRMILLANGFNQIKVSQVLSPAWSTDWMSEEGKKKLQAYGIAPPNPVQQVCRNDLFAPHEAVECPHCHSFHTHRISEFGSTACKALYQCDDCMEPFDYFKCH